MAKASKALFARWDDVVLVNGARTPFVDYGEDLALVSPIDLGIKAGRAALAASNIAAADVGAVIVGMMAQASFDAYMTPRHIGLYSGVPTEVPAHLVQRVCGTGIEVVSQAADAVSSGRADAVLCVGTESMSRNPIAAYTVRSGFRMGQVAFKDFLYESLLDPAAEISMGGTAENLAKRYDISRPEVDAFAARSFARAVGAREAGFFDGEVVPLGNESFEIDGLVPRGIRLKSRDRTVSADSHVRPSPIEALAKIRPAFGGVQTGGNSSAIVDGAAGVVAASRGFAAQAGLHPLARIVAAAAVGVPPEVMGIGPVPAIREICERTGLSIAQIDRFEINEAFGAQVMACSRELGLDEAKLNVNGGAIAIGHPLAATGVRLCLTLARTLTHSGTRWGIASACIGGGQGIAMLLENEAAA